MLGATGLTAALDAYLAGGSPTGFEIMRRAAEDAAAYDVMQRWACTDRPVPAPLRLCETLIPHEVLREWERTLCLDRTALLAELSEALPRAVRRHACSRGCRGGPLSVQAASRSVVRPTPHS